MANNGFSAAEEIFGSITGLKAKESSDGNSGSVAEAQNEFGDTVATDEYGERCSPSVTYAVTDTVTTLPALGSIKSWGSKKIMVTQIAVSTSAGQPPTVTISGEEVPSTLTERRTYAVTCNLAPRCKAQDVAGAFDSANYLTSCNTTYAVDFVNATVAGEIVSACASHGRTEVNATITDPTGSATLTAAQGFVMSSPAAKTAPDEAYVTVTATATKFIVGTEAASDS